MDLTGQGEGGPAKLRPGRWRSGSQTRRRIIDAARTRFGAEGYDRATIRSVAAEAGVDPAMVYYFFGSKNRLFAAAMALPDSPRERLAEILHAGADDLGARLVRSFLQAWDSAEAREAFLGLARSAPSHEEWAHMLREFIEQELAGQLLQVIDAPDARLRAALVSGQILGLAFARFIAQLEPVASAPPETLVAWLGPVVQAFLTGPPPSLPESPTQM